MRSEAWARMGCEATMISSVSGPPKLTLSMHSAHRAVGLDRRLGFTLLELMLVLAILVVIAAIATPVLDRVLERQKLRGAAEELRLAWENARLTAMRTGQVQVFTCEIGERAYSIDPMVLHDDVNNAADGATLFSGGTAVQLNTSNLGVNLSSPMGNQSKAGELDEAVVFASCRVASDTRAFSMTNPALGGNQSGTSVIFYPDGTTSTAEVLIQTKGGEVTGIQIRGLTGHSRLLGVTSSSEAGLKR
jgi:prepilin-type N-terminal cleavage/methylation domain-containing protein